MGKFYFALVMSVLMLPSCEIVPPAESDEQVIIWQGQQYCRDYQNAKMCEGE